MLVVKFENPPGTVLNTRRFTPGQNLRVGAQVTTPLGGPAPGVATTFELYDTSFEPYYTGTTTDFFGNAWVDWILPGVTSRATIRVVAQSIIPGTNEVVEIPVGIGTNPLPIPGEINTTALWIIGGAVLVGAVLVGVFHKAPVVINIPQRQTS
jgi:hypothetical protein